MRTLRSFIADDVGFIISAELVLVLTIAVLAMIVGLHEVAVAVNTELNDVSSAIGALNQSFFFCGFTGASGIKIKSVAGGSSFIDISDDCDCNTSCDLVCAVPTPESGPHL